MSGSPNLNIQASSKWTTRLSPELRLVRENSAVAPGLESLLPLSPALKRWAKMDCPSGTGFSILSFSSSARGEAEEMIRVQGVD